MFTDTPNSDHFRRLFEHGAEDMFSASFVANAVYTQRYRSMNIWSCLSKPWLKILADIEQRRGKTMNGEEALAEMNRAF
jgi:hypothetical protein